MYPCYLGGKFSYYFQFEVIDFQHFCTIFRELSEDLCSLNPGIDRLTFTVEWELKKTGDVVSVSFGKSIIRYLRLLLIFFD